MVLAAETLVVKSKVHSMTKRLVWYFIVFSPCGHGFHHNQSLTRYCYYISRLFGLMIQGEGDNFLIRPLFTHFCYGFSNKVASLGVISEAVGSFTLMVLIETAKTV
jgi:hypothetical protein